jgi:hypothetical protein
VHHAQLVHVVDDQHHRPEVVCREQSTLSAGVCLMAVRHGAISHRMRMREPEACRHTCCSPLCEGSALHDAVKELPAMAQLQHLSSASNAACIPVAAHASVQKALGCSLWAQGLQGLTRCT